MKKAEVLISVIIPTKNEGKNIGRLLASLAQQTFKNYEIIVVDNFSTDNTRQIALQHTPLVFKSGNERSAQRNFGVQKASGKYLLFVDADMQLEMSVLSQCVHKMEQNPALAGIIIDEISSGSGFLTKVKNLEEKIYQGQAELEAARFFKKRDLIAVGGWDNRLIAGEDWDLTTRIRARGELGRISAKINHFQNHSLLSDLKKKYYYAKNIKHYAKKQPEKYSQQANPLFRFLILFKKPDIILAQPAEFTGLIALKTAHWAAYLLARLHAKI